MERRPAFRTFSWHALVALACILSLGLAFAAIGIQRGVIMSHHVEDVMLAAETGQPAPSDLAATACPFSGVNTPALVDTCRLRRPTGPERPIRLAYTDDVPLRAHTAGTPFRPPRAA
jgi:hypothetical protein